MIAARPKLFRVVLLGPPASGKGTQGRRLAASLGVDYLSTGALLREHVENRTALGRQAAPVLARGEYLPDELMFPILADWLGSRAGGWVLDGFPRSVPQAVFLDGWLEERRLALDAAVSLEVPFGELLSRVTGRVECPACRWTGQRPQLLPGDLCPVCHAPAGRRPDDGEENFRRRHIEFESLTRPVIDRYAAAGLLHPCDATAPQEEVAARLLAEFSPEKAPAP